eukprot:131977-Chlamydomonas_euryale.AAC.6
MQRAANALAAALGWFILRAGGWLRISLACVTKPATFLRAGSGQCPALPERAARLSALRRRRRATQPMAAWSAGAGAPRARAASRRVDWGDRFRLPGRAGSAAAGDGAAYACPCGEAG